MERRKVGEGERKGMSRRVSGHLHLDSPGTGNEPSTAQASPGIPGWEGERHGEGD